MTASDALARFLEGCVEGATETARWGNGTTPLRITAYLTEGEPPLPLVTSVRAVVLRGDAVLVFWDHHDRPQLLPGGRREEGEFPLATLRREVAEETGIEVRNPVPLGCLVHEHLDEAPTGYAYPYPHFVQSVYLAEAGDERPEKRVFDPYVTRSAFCPISEVETMPLRAVDRSFLTAALALRDRPEGAMTDFDRLPRRSQIERMRALAVNALSSYGMADAPFRLLSADQFFNTSFLVTPEDEERFVLRIHRPSINPRKRTKIESELWWLGHVREHLGLAVPEPVLTADGDLLVSAEAEGVPGPRFCVLFRWMEGRFLHRGLRPRHLELVGRMTARLHNDSARLAVPDWFLRNTVDRADPDSEESVAGILAREWSPDAASTARGVVRRAREAAEELGGGPEVFGVIHADIHQWNYLFREGEIELIDFDDSGWGHYLYDLAVTTAQLVCMPDGPRLQAALFRGYRQVRDLSPWEEALVETFRMLREIQDLAWLLERREDPAYARFLPQIGPTLAEMERFLAAR